MMINVYEPDAQKRTQFTEIAANEGVEIKFFEKKEGMLDTLTPESFEFVVCSPNLARFHSLCRVVKAENEKDIQGDLVLDHSIRKVFLNGKEILLTITEYKILMELMDNKGRVIDRNYLANSVLKSAGQSSRSLDVHVFSLRKKLDIYGDHLKTIRGVGYTLDM